MQTVSQMHFEDSL